MEVYVGEEHVNVGAGHDITIAELAQTIREVTGFRGRLTYDRSKPDGTPRKLLDVTRMTGLGWRATIALPEGLAETYRWFLDTADASSPRAHTDPPAAGTPAGTPTGRTDDRALRTGRTIGSVGSGRDG